ncbi:MAG: DUF4827 domain-containing protein [Bacteroides sp.]|nr:DUF4827 domain-containing protein [Bacteroides sp.]
MKKILPFIFALMAISAIFCACDETKTYAEKMEEEDDAIEAFIRDSSITVISQSEFYANDSVTDVSKNEYVQLASGVYMQIVDKGSENLADTIRPNEVVLVRFSEYSLFDKMVTVSNLETPYMVDEFRYTVTSSSIAGIFSTGTVGAMYYYYGSTTVPAGWLAALAYIRDGAHVKLIVPHKMGHDRALSNVYPYFYDLRKIQFWR